MRKGQHVWRCHPEFTLSSAVQIYIVEGVPPVHMNCGRTDTQTHRQTDRQTDRHTHTHTHAHTNRQTDKQSDQVKNIISYFKDIIMN